MKNFIDSVSNFFKKRFNTIKTEDENSVRFFNPDATGFVPTKAEIEYAEKLAEEGVELDALVADRLERLGYGGAYKEACYDLDAYWKEFLEIPYKERGEKEHKTLKKFQERVYELRATACREDEYLDERYSEWMGKHPTTKNFDRYAEIMGFEPDSVETLHAKMMTPAKLIGKFIQSESSEARYTKKEDFENEPNRDNWFNFDVSGKDGRTKDKEKTDPENLAAEQERKLSRQFKWLLDKESSSILDIGAELMLRYDSLFSSDVIKQRILKAFGHEDKNLYRVLMMSQDRIDEAEKKEVERAEWRHKVEEGVIPSFDWDMYLLLFGRVKNITWQKMGGVFKCAWGAMLQFECVPDLKEEYKQICRNVTCYNDADPDDKESKPSITSYKGAKDKMLANSLLRRKKGNLNYPTQFLEWNRALITLLMDQSPSFCYQLTKIEGKTLPEDKFGYNQTWYQALTEAIPSAKRHVANRAEKIVVDHDYSTLEDIYGDEAEALALECLLAIKEKALEAAAEQRAYIGNRQIAGYSDVVECCEF